MRQAVHLIIIIIIIFCLVIIIIFFVFLNFARELVAVRFQSFKCYTGKNNGFPFLDIFGYLKNTHKNPKFGRVRQVPIRELGWEFPGWDLSHFVKFGIFMGIL